MRRAASWTHPLHVRFSPRVARTMRRQYIACVEEWRKNLIENDEARIDELLRAARRVAVLGIKTEDQSWQAAFYVPAALQEMGLEIVPVPVYFPDAVQILGKQGY